MNFLSELKGFLAFRKIIKSQNKKNIVFFAETKNYRNYFLNLVRSLEEEEDLNIIYLTSDIKDTEKITNKIKPIFIGSGFFRILIFTFIKCEMVIMTLTDLGNHEIVKSKKCKNYVYIFHSLISTHKSYTRTAFDNFDIIFSNGEYQKKELLYCEKLFNLKKKQIYNTGYLYLEKLNHHKKTSLKKFQRKKLLFATTWNKNSNNLFDNYAQNVLSKLLDLKYEVVLRTHPETLKRSKKTINKIKEKFKNNKNFEINTDLLNLDPLTESSILITDDGGIALEYYIIYKKPVLYINHLKKINNHSYDKIKLVAIEDDFKKEIGTSIEINQLDDINLFLEKAERDFESNKQKISNLIEKNQIILNDQTLNAKKTILKILN